MPIRGQNWTPIDTQGHTPAAGAAGGMRIAAWRIIRRRRTETALGVGLHEKGLLGEAVHFVCGYVRAAAAAIARALDVFESHVRQ